MADEAVTREIEADNRIYQLAGAGTIPKLLTERLIIAGEPASAEKLFEVLEKQVGVCGRPSPMPRITAQWPALNLCRAPDGVRNCSRDEIGKYALSFWPITPNREAWAAKFAGLSNCYAGGW